MVEVPSGFPVVVVGAGPAGLAVSYELTARGIEHVVLERARVGQTWRDLWDSFCLVTPNWTMSLPGAPYTGDDPEGFVPRDEIVRYLQRYASSFGAPVREGVGVDSLEPGPGGGFLLRTSAGELRASSVVVCTGAYQRPHRPQVAAGFPRDLLVTDAEGYRVRRPFRRGRSWSWAAARPVASSPRSCTSRVARCSAPTTPTGSGSRRSTPWASHSPTTVQAPWFPAYTSAASTSCASASPRCCSGWARMPPSWPNPSPTTGHGTTRPCWTTARSKSIERRIGDGGAGEHRRALPARG